MIIKMLWSYCDRVSFLKKIDRLNLLYPNFLVKSIVIMFDKIFSVMGYILLYRNQNTLTINMVYNYVFVPRYLFLMRIISLRKPLYLNHEIFSDCHKALVS